MSLGCPVACSDTSAIREIAGNCAELFDPSDATSICNAVTRIVLSPEHAENLRNKGKAHAATFSWDKCASDTLDVYRKVLDTDSPQPPHTSSEAR